jgi:hypothetical protein
VRIAGDPSEGAGAVIKASTEILDRAGIPRVAATILQADITHREGRTAAQIVRERLGSLGSRLADRDEDDLPEPPKAVTVVDALPDEPEMAASEPESPAEPVKPADEGKPSLRDLSERYAWSDHAP